MQVDLEEFLNNKIIGNIRSGTRGEKGEPKKLPFFNVHIDKSTSALAVEIFNQKYEKSNKLKIRFVNQNPMEIFLELYEGKKRKCYGNNKKAKFLNEKGKIEIINCNSKECSYKKNGQCKYVAKLYFIINGLEKEGIWCYPIR